MKDETTFLALVKGRDALEKLRLARRTIEELEVNEGSPEARAELGAILQAIGGQEAALKDYTERLQSRWTNEGLNWGQE